MVNKRRRLQRSCDGLADIHAAGDHRAVNRCVNGGVVQISLGYSDGRLFLLHLRHGLRDGCLGRCHCRISGIGIGFGQIQLLLAHHSFFGEAGSPLIVGPGLQRCSLRLFVVGLGRNHIGFRIGQVCFGLQQRSLK